LRENHDQQEIIFPQVGEKFLHLRKRHVFTLDQANLKEEISMALSRFSSQAVTRRK
jgi:hypothetical protein